MRRKNVYHYWGRTGKGTKEIRHIIRKSTRKRRKHKKYQKSLFKRY